MKRLVLVLSGAVVLGPAARAQERPTFTFSGAGAMVWVRSDTAGGAVRLRGPVLAGEGRVALHGVTLAAGLLEGRLQAVGGGAGVPRDLVEARVSVAARPVPWFEVSVGPIVRAYVADTLTERWVFWQARARVDAPILTARLAGYVELWRALSSSATLVPAAGRVQGGEAGVAYQPPRGRLSLRLAYRVDDAVVGAAGSETLEAVSLAVAVTVP